MRIHANLIASTLIVLFLAGCGGDAGPSVNTGPGGGGGGGTGPDASTYKSINAKLATLANQDPSAVTPLLATYVKTLPGVVASTVTVSDNNVFANLKSGQRWGFIGNRNAAGKKAAIVKAGGPPKGSTSAVGVKPKATGGVNLPASNSYLSMTGFGTYNDAGASSNIAGMLDRAGYASGGSSVVSIASLKALGTPAVLYISTHGFIDNKHFWLWTSDAPADPNGDDASDPVVQANGGPNYVTKAYQAPQDTTDPGYYSTPTHYCVSELFLAKYLKVQQGGLIYMDVCQAGSAGSPLLITLLGSNAGANCLYDNDVDSAGGAAADCYIFDRMTGDNGQSGAAPAESPLQRPFDLAACVSDAQRAKVLPVLTKMQPTNLVAAGQLALRPSIEYVTVDGYKQSGSVTGQFGSTQGTLKIGGNSVSIKKWSPTEIDFQNLPDDAQGDVVVSVNNVTSNPVQLTYWQLLMNYTVSGPGGLLLKDKMTINIRADVHAFRQKIHGTPIKSIIPWDINKDSTSSWTGSGSDEEISYSGSGSTPPLSPSDSAGGNLYFTLGDFNTQIGRFDIQMVEIIQNAYTITVHGVAAQAGFGLNPKLFIPPPDNNHFPMLEIPLSSDFVIQGDSRTYSLSGVDYKLEWSDAEPVSPPNNQDGV